MRPTEAEVNYEWLTPVRDWTDPSPKYLVATYEGARSRRKSAEQLRYGGFVVRVYFDGQLQAERSEPKELVAALRSEAKPAASPPAVASTPATPIAVATPSPEVAQPRALENETAQNPTDNCSRHAALNLRERQPGKFLRAPLCEPGPRQTRFCL